MFKTVFQRIRSNFKKGPELMKAFQKQGLIASSLIGASLYLQNKNIKDAYAQQASQNGNKSREHDESGNKNRIQWVEFSEENYAKAEKDGHNVIIFLEPSRFNDKFITEVDSFLENVNQFQSIVKGRPIVFMKLEFTQKSSLQSFINKYQVDIEEETLFLLRNQYTDLRSFAFSEYFQDKDSLVKYFRAVPQLNQTNQNEFINSLDYLTSDAAIIVVYCPQNDPQYDRLHKRFGALFNFKQYSENKNVHFVLLNDEETAKSIGLNDVKVGDMHLVLRKSKMSYGKSTHNLNGKQLYIQKFANLKENMKDIIKACGTTYNEMNIFTRNSFDFDVRYSIVLEIDENRLSKQDRKKLVQLMSEFHQHLREKEPELYKNVQFVYVKNTNESKKWNIYVRDDFKYGLRIKQHGIKTKEELDEVKNHINDESHSFVYNFPSKNQTPEVPSLTQWLREVQDSKAKESFKSQTPPNYRKYSKKLVGKTFESEVQNNDRDQVVFFYSKHCHACKAYGQHYENLALEYLRKDPFSTAQVEFNRMNSDRNTLKTGPNLPYTPVFMVFKKGEKKTPYFYSSTTFTPMELRTFVENTIGFKLIDSQKFNQHVQTVINTDLSGIFDTDNAQTKQR